MAESLVCPKCMFQAKAKKGLVSHMRKHDAEAMRNRDEQFIKELRERFEGLGLSVEDLRSKLENIDSGLKAVSLKMEAKPSEEDYREARDAWIYHIAGKECPTCNRILVERHRKKLVPAEAKICEGDSCPTKLELRRKETELEQARSRIKELEEKLKPKPKPKFLI